MLVTRSTLKSYSFIVESGVKVTCFFCPNSSRFSCTTVFLIQVFNCYFSLNCTAQNNCFTRHLAKILIHLAWCLQALVGTSGVQSESLTKAVNALHISTVFLQYLIENAKGNSNEGLYLSMDESESLPDSFPRGKFLHF